MLWATTQDGAVFDAVVGSQHGISFENNMARQPTPFADLNTFFDDTKRPHGHVTAKFGMDTDHSSSMNICSQLLSLTSQETGCADRRRAHSANQPIPIKVDSPFCRQEAEKNLHKADFPPYSNGLWFRQNDTIYRLSGYLYLSVSALIFARCSALRNVRRGN